MATSAPAPPASDPAGRLGPSCLTGPRIPGPTPIGEGTQYGRTSRPPARAKLAEASPGPGVGDCGPGRPGLRRSGLADQSDRCPPRCDELTGAGDLTSSSGTTVQAVGVGPETIDSGVDVAGPTTTAPSVGPTTVGGSRTDAPTSGATQISTTTSRSSRAKPDLAVGSNPPAAERSAHHRPDDHQTEAIDHDDIIDHHHHDHDRPQRALRLDNRLSRRLEPLRPAHPQAPTRARRLWYLKISVVHPSRLGPGELTRWRQLHGHGAGQPLPRPRSSRCVWAGSAPAPGGRTRGGAGGRRVLSL